MPDYLNKNTELALKFLKETEYIEECAGDNDPCYLCDGATEEDCENCSN